MLRRGQALDLRRKSCGASGRLETRNSTAPNKRNDCLQITYLLTYLWSPFGDGFQFRRQTRLPKSTILPTIFVFFVKFPVFGRLLESAVRALRLLLLMNWIARMKESLGPGPAYQDPMGGGGVL